MVTRSGCGWSTRIRTGCAGSGGDRTCLNGDGTVREDISAGGDAWASFTHDQARSRGYRWGALLNLHVYYGDDLTVDCPTGSGRQLNLSQVAREISDRLIATFLKGADGHRPVHGGQPILQLDPYWHDLPLLYEYFHGDNGAGIGASHQTGWTGIAARNSGCAPSMAGTR